MPPSLKSEGAVASLSSPPSPPPPLFLPLWYIEANMLFIISHIMYGKVTFLHVCAHFISASQVPIMLICAALIFIVPYTTVNKML